MFVVNDAADGIEQEAEGLAFPHTERQSHCPDRKGIFKFLVNYWDTKELTLSTTMTRQIGDFFNHWLPMDLRKRVRQNSAMLRFHTNVFHTSM